MEKSIENNGLYWKITSIQITKILLSVFLIASFVIIYHQHNEIKKLKMKVKIQNNYLQKLDNRIKNIEYNME